jgi:hypothetical protein
VRIQIYIVLIAFMMLCILHHTAARSLKASAALLLVQFKVSLFSPLDLRKTNKPPPRPPNWRTPHPQLRLAFQ